jgi:hypothetical protein
MPRKAQYGARLIFRMTRIEAEALKFLGGPRGASDAIRKILWFYLKNAGDFDASAFRDHVRKNLVPKLGPEGRERLLRDLDAMDQAVVRDAPSPASAPLLDNEALDGWLDGKGS